MKYILLSVVSFQVLRKLLYVHDHEYDEAGLPRSFGLNHDPFVLSFFSHCFL